MYSRRNTGKSLYWRPHFRNCNETQNHIEVLMMVASLNRGPQYRQQYIMVLIIGTRKMPLILRQPLNPKPYTLNAEPFTLTPIYPHRTPIPPVYLPFKVPTILGKLFMFCDRLPGAGLGRYEHWQLAQQSGQHKNLPVITSSTPPLSNECSLIIQCDYILFQLFLVRWCGNSL